MNGVGGIALLWFLCGSTGFTLLNRMASAHRPHRQLSSSRIIWPLALRPFLATAGVISGWIGNRLPNRLNARIRRRLEKADLHPGADASQWTALCISVSLTAAIVVGVVAYVASVSTVTPSVVTALTAWVSCERWLYRRGADCERRIVRELPACLDLLTICVEAGATLGAAARFVVEQAPDGPLRNYFERVLREVRSGRSRSQAFVSVADAYGVECLSTLASALSHAEAAGMSVGQVLRTQAEQRSTERFVRAERLAMQAPVKMLGPLILCIFPCTFIVLAIPIAHRLMEAFRT
jgi:tight adherence protein C